MKALLCVFLLALTVSAVQAQECASNTAELRELTGHSDLSLKWLENINNKDRQLTLKLANSGSELSLDLAIPSGNWAKVTGIVCKTGDDTFSAKVSSMTWGPTAPGLVKFAGKPKVLKLQLLYPTLLKVSAKGMNFQFSPL